MIDLDTPQAEIAERIMRMFECYGLEPTPDGWRDLALALIVDLSTAALPKFGKNGMGTRKLAGRIGFDLATAKPELGDGGMSTRELAEWIGVALPLAKPPKPDSSAEHAMRFHVMDSFVGEIDPATGKNRTAKEAAKLTAAYLAEVYEPFALEGQKLGVPKHTTIAEQYSDDVRPPSEAVATAIVDSAFHSRIVRRIGDVARTLGKAD
jgi:hypothetical protein